MTLERLRRLLQVSLAGIIVAAGAGVTVWLIRTKPLPPKRAAAQRLPQVEVAVVEPTVYQVPVVGYGTVRPKNQVQIVPQVNGKLVFSHEDLAVGKVLQAGELLFEIDPVVYEARLRQREAEIRVLEATLARHDQEMANLDERIANAEQMLAIAKADYDTSKDLYENQRVGTHRDVDLVHQKYLQQKDAIVELTSRRALVPHLKLESQARLDAARAALNQAQHDLESTKIFCPFKARVESVSAHASQVVTPPLAIATLTDLEALEISVGIDPRELRWLDGAIQPNALAREEEGPSPEVTVTWSLPGQRLAWRGRVTRFERVDEATRTARMVVEIRDVDMTARLESGSIDTAPALSIGMHCRAELPTAPLQDALVIPRHAIHDSHWVYVFAPDDDPATEGMGRLEKRRVSMLRGLGDHVLVDYRGRDDTAPCELEAGELLIVSPLIKPVPGMRVALPESRVASAAAPSTAAERPVIRRPVATVFGRACFLAAIR